jgi:hypothetical protein
VVRASCVDTVAAQLAVLQAGNVCHQGGRQG